MYVYRQMLIRIEKEIKTVLFEYGHKQLYYHDAKINKFFDSRNGFSKTLSKQTHCEVSKLYIQGAVVVFDMAVVRI